MHLAPLDPQKLINSEDIRISNFEILMTVWILENSLNDVILGGLATTVIRVAVCGGVWLGAFSASQHQVHTACSA
jgi:hypothetical protein